MSGDVLADIGRRVADREADTARAGRYAAAAVAASFAGNGAHLAATLFRGFDSRAEVVELVAEHLFGPFVVLIATHLLLHSGWRHRAENLCLWVGVLAGFFLSAIHLHGLAAPALGDNRAVVLPVAVEAASIGSILQYARNRDDRERLARDLVEVRARVEGERVEAEQARAEAVMAAEAEREREAAELERVRLEAETEAARLAAVEAERAVEADRIERERREAAAGLLAARNNGSGRSGADGVPGKGRAGKGPVRVSEGVPGTAEAVAAFQALHPRATRSEIAAAVGVSARTVSRYWTEPSSEGPAEEADGLDDQEAGGVDEPGGDVDEPVGDVDEPGGDVDEPVGDVEGLAGGVVGRCRVEVLTDGGPAINGHRLSAPGKPWKYTKTPEFVLYLLLHPAGVSQDRIMEALFPGEPVNRQRLNLLASDARTKILGPDVLPPASPVDPWYRLAVDRIDFDLIDFAAHCARADRTDNPTERAQHLTNALDLITGRPFDVPHNGYAWAVADIEATTIRIEQTALALAALATAAGDHTRAVWATTKAMTDHTGSVELLMARGRAALAAQDPEAIVRAFTDLRAALGAEPGETLDWIDDALAELITDLDQYRRQRLGRRAA